MKDFEYKTSLTFIPMIIMISSMVSSLSVVSVVFWAIGIAMTFTVLDRKGVGINLMNNIKRRIILGIGMTITICSLIDEVSLLALVLFVTGYVLAIAASEKSNQEKI